MSDLQLESLNKAGKTTMLEAVPTTIDSLAESGADYGFLGPYILEVVPETALRDGTEPASTSFGGILGQGAVNGPGVRGVSRGGPGVLGEGRIGIRGQGTGQDAIGVSGTIVGGSGVGVGGVGSPGVLGTSVISSGVQGEGTPGVLGQCSANPFVVTPVHPDPGHFAGVNGNSAHGPGVFGTGVYGGQFQGSRAQLSLLPGTSVGKPTTGPHDLGEIYMDSAASLFVCIATGTPGTWVKVVTA